jgi:hypothetical protein
MAFDLSGRTPLISTTPLAEYIDMIYTRLAIALGKYGDKLTWWVELHPPESKEDGAGYVVIKGRIKDWIPTYRASMHAIEHGARCSASVLETVVNHHVKEFTKSVETSV